MSYNKKDTSNLYSKEKTIIINDMIYSIGKSSEGFTYLKYFLKNRKNIKSFLDIGCGNGNLLKLLDKNTSYLGVDANAGIYKQKKNKYIKYFKTSKQTENFIKKQNKKFDCVVLMDVLEHTDTFLDLFDLALKKSKNYVIVGLPNEDSFLSRINFFIGKGIPTHGLEMIGTKPGHKHQWLIQYKKALFLLTNSAKKYKFNLYNKYFYITLPNNYLKRIIYKIILFFLPKRIKMNNFCLIFSKKIN